VTIDDQEALCVKFDCGYTYETPTGEITTLAVDHSTRKVTLEGTNLPTDLTAITLGYINCVIDTSTNTDILVECVLDDPLIAGKWKPKVYDAKGILPVSDSLIEETVALVVTSITPDTNVNPAGGDEITITGSGFPSSLTVGNIAFSLVFNEDGTICDLISTTPTQMVCKPRAFNLSTRRRRDRRLNEGRTLNIIADAME
jgi:hypothetical protein